MLQTNSNELHTSQVSKKHKPVNLVTSIKDCVMQRTGKRLLLYLNLNHNFMGKFDVSKQSNGDLHFNLKADNGQVILTSQGYSSRVNCDNGIDSVRKNSKKDSNFDRKISTNDKHYFNLKAANGLIIGTSEMYEGSSSMETGIASVKKNAPKASVEG
jgi:uncharacterized protein YegP (UPF0339 family)